MEGHLLHHLWMSLSACGIVSGGHTLLIKVNELAVGNPAVAEMLPRVAVANARPSRGDQKSSNVPRRQSSEFPRSMIESGASTSALAD